MNKGGCCEHPPFCTEDFMPVKVYEPFLGKVVIKIDSNKIYSQLIFHCDDGSVWVMDHTQDCCENVYLEDVVGDLDDLLNSPILVAEVVKSDEDLTGERTDHYGSFLWTFYKLGTIKGTVTLRWFGESKGCYSVEVDFKAIPQYGW